MSLVSWVAVSALWSAHIVATKEAWRFWNCKIGIISQNKRFYKSWKIRRLCTRTEILMPVNYKIFSFNSLACAGTTKSQLKQDKIFLLRFSMSDRNRDSFLSESWQKISSRERERGRLWFTWVLYHKGKWSKKDGSHNDKKVKRSTKPFVCAAGDQALYFPLFSAIFSFSTVARQPHQAKRSIQKSQKI